MYYFSPPYDLKFLSRVVATCERSFLMTANCGFLELLLFLSETSA